METPTLPQPLTKKDFVTANEVRWCPGCGDYAILHSLQRTLPELGVPREKFVIVSGIGCSSRFPYYMETYGFHSIHGRAPTIATGIKVANPDLDVWVVTGDGDALSIGGNHFLHALRRNVDIKILLFNNRIYGLTKGQYSPTSPFGLKTKSTPYGAIDNPVNPLLLAIAAEATFVARTLDSHPKHMIDTFKAAHAHKGVAFIEILQNCVIFNDGTWDSIAGREVREERLLFLEEGKPLRFGPKLEKGIRLVGLQPEVVDLQKHLELEPELLIHTPASNGLYAEMLARMTWPDLPSPVGVLRRCQRPTYEQLIDTQIAEARRQKGPSRLEEVLRGSDTWTVE